MTAKDWEVCPHNIMKCETDSVLKKYPELMPIFGKYLKEDRELIFKYIIAYYNEKSPVRAEQDIVARKKLAASVAGFKPDSRGKFPAVVEDILVGKNNDVNKLIIDYCYSQNTSKFTLLAVYEQGLYIEMLNLVSMGFNKDTSKKVKEIIEDIDLLQNEILSGHRILKDLVQALSSVTEKIKLELQPEEIADKIKKGEKPVDVTPYGKDYNFKKYGKKGSLRQVRNTDR